MTLVQRVNLGLRFATEVGIVVGLAWWGLQATGRASWDIVLCVAAPAVVFGIWALVDFRWAGRWSEPLRLLEELVISGAAAFAWYVTGRHAAAWAVAAASIADHALRYLTGGRLLAGRGQR